MNPSMHTDDARFLELLERWLQGDFTRSDEQELHALAAADDFRREAWEGFTALPEDKHEARLASLRGRFPARPGGRRVPLTVWMSLAAIMLLLIAAVYFIPGWLSSDARPVAQKSEAPVPEREVRPVTEQPEAAVTPEQESFSKKSVTTAHAPVRSVEAPHVSSAESDELADAISFRQERAKEQGIPPLPPLARDSQIYVVAGPAGAPQQLPANVFPGGPAGNAVFPSSAPSTQAPYAAEKPVAARKQVLNEADKSARQASAEKKAAPAEAKKKAAPVPPPPLTATPAGGWDNFRLYLQINAHLTDSARNNDISGQVRLRFQIGQDGKPANVEVLKSLGYGCDEEAIRLIRSVFWTPGGIEPVTVDVPFVR